MTGVHLPLHPSSRGGTLGLFGGNLGTPKNSDTLRPATLQASSDSTAAGDVPSVQTANDESSTSSPSKRTWNYRVISFRHGEEAWCAIHEVYYDDGVPTGHTVEPAVAMWDPEEGDDAGVRTLERMREALAKPVLTESDFRRRG